jgi:hypothetical protein
MASINWLVFREIYFKISLSIFVVIAAMLVLQDSLNHLKLRALVAEATSSRLQISASTVESAIVRAEGLGLSMDEMVGLQDLLDRERERDGSITKIEIVSPIGAPVVSSGEGPPISPGRRDAEGLPKEREQALRRVLGAREKVTIFDAGPHLYTGRTIFDSSGSIMGAIILTTPTRQYMERAQIYSHKMRSSYVMVFALVAMILIPFIVYQFSGVRHAFRAFDPELVGKDIPQNNFPQDTKDLIAAIEMGNRSYSETSEELDDILKLEAKAPAKKKTPRKTS